VAEACGDDDSLRPEVESLLAYEDQAEDFIESPPLEIAAQMMAEERRAGTCWFLVPVVTSLIYSFLGLRQ
jgi:hypothetical protein